MSQWRQCLATRNQAYWFDESGQGRLTAATLQRHCSSSPEAVGAALLARLRLFRGGHIQPPEETMKSYTKLNFGKTLSLAVAGALLLGLAACDQKPKADEPGKTFDKLVE